MVQEICRQRVTIQLTRLRSWDSLRVTCITRQGSFIIHLVVAITAGLIDTALISILDRFRNDFDIEPIVNPVALLWQIPKTQKIRMKNRTGTLARKLSNATSRVTSKTQMTHAGPSRHQCSYKQRV